MIAARTDHLFAPAQLRPRTNIYMRSIVGLVQRWHPFMGTHSAATCLYINQVPIHVALRVLTRTKP